MSHADSPDIVIPGLVDLQVNGTNGVDFSAQGLTVSDCTKAFGFARDGGTASFLPTVITLPLDQLQDNLTTIAGAIRSAGSTAAVGIHLEGPFLDPTPGAIGAHNPDWVVNPDPATFDRLQESADGLIRLLTVAAGMPGVETLISHAVRSGVVVALGHHMGGYDAVRSAADAGATLLTHLGNGLPHHVGRHENPLLAGLYDERLAATVIGDGHHLPCELLQLISRVKGVDSTILVSDAAPITGLAPGTYQNMGSEVELTDDGLVVNPRTRYLAGSGRTLLQCANRLLKTGCFSPAQIRRMACENPAGVLNLDPSALSGPELYLTGPGNVFAISTST